MYSKKEKISPLKSFEQKGDWPIITRGDLMKYITGYKVKEDSVFFVDSGIIMQQIQRFSDLFPNIHPFYAIKANDDKKIIKLLAERGVNFDCASKREIETVLRIFEKIESEKNQNSNLIVTSPSPRTEERFSYGIREELVEQTNRRISSRIVLSNPYKKSSAIQYSLDRGVSIMTFDSFEEMKKLVGLRDDVHVLIRLKVDCTGSITLLSKKYGSSVENAFKLIDFSLDYEHIHVVGVSFHIGSGCSQPKLFRAALDRASRVFEYGDKLGCSMDILDIGGGFPGSIQPAGIKLLHDISKNLKSGLLEYFGIDLENGRMNGITVIAEPGRFFVSESHILVAPIIGKKINSKRNYIISDGLYGALNNIVFDGFKIVNNCCNGNDDRNFDVLKHGGEDICLDQKNCFSSTLWGPTCDSLDKIGECVLPELEVGDYVCFYEQGAYTSCASCCFNGFPRAKKIFVV